MFDALQIDAQTALGFVTNQAYVINARTYETVYPDYDYGRFVAVDSSTPEWAGGITTFITDTVGKAEWFRGSAMDMPLADVTRDMVEKSFSLAGIGYEYDLEEIGKAMFLGIGLQPAKAFAARRAYNQFMYSLTLTGNTPKGLKGLFNYTGVTAINAPADGTGSSTYWADKTADLILRDINLALSPIFTSSLTTEMADTILLPYDALLLLMSMRIGTNLETTVFDWIKEKNVFTLMTGRPLNILGARGLEDVAASSKGRMVAYRNSEDVVKLHLPMPHRFMNVWQNGPLNFLVPGIFRTGGIEVLRPAAFRYLDLITA